MRDFIVGLLLGSFSMNTLAALAAFARGAPDDLWQAPALLAVICASVLAGIALAKAEATR